MKNISVFFSALVALLFSVAETSAQITPPYYNPANVRITGGTINGTVIGGTTAAAGSFTTLSATGTVTLGAATNEGVTLRAFTGGNGFSLYSRAITPVDTNFSFFTNASSSAINGTTYSRLQVNGTTVAEASSTGLAVTNTTDASSTITGSLRTAGGLGVVKKSFFGGALQVGSGSGTSAGLIAGYLGSSGYGAIWSTGVTPSTTNYSFTTNGSVTAQNGSSSSNLNVAGNAILETSSTLITGNVPIKLKGYTVATLPAAGTAGRMAYVTDATAPTYNGALVGGGAVVVPVFDNGAAWVSH